MKPFAFTIVISIIGHPGFDEAKLVGRVYVKEGITIKWKSFPGSFARIEGAVTVVDCPLHYNLKVSMLVTTVRPFVDCA